MYNTVLKLNMPKWTAHMVATFFSLGSADQVFVIFFVYHAKKRSPLPAPFLLFPFSRIIPCPPAILIHM
ncbi:hypothetical protein ACS54_19045 [Bacillus cereus]|nr:hypothetical protein ACS54_19045 [Bacillus cereus]